MITSRHNAIVARYRSAERGDDPAVMLLDGVHLVADALAAELRLRDVAVAAGAESRADVAALLQRLGAAGTSTVTVSAPVMAALSPVRSASPIVALAMRPPTEPAPVYRHAVPLVVIAADLQDPGNFGAIVRVAEAAGASGVVAAGACADPFGWKALRGSMGSALRLPITVAVDVAAAVAQARAHHCRIVATVPRGGRRPVDCDLTRPTAAIIGGEGQGLPQSVAESADDRVTIPMQAPVESLNAAVTAALLLYEARRQRDHETHQTRVVKP